MYGRDRSSPALGIKKSVVKAGYAEMTLTVEPWMVNGAGVCHGGLIFALADTAMAFASNSYNEQMLAINATIEFLAAGSVGDTLTAIATEAHKAGRTATYNVAVRNKNDELVAEFLGRTYKVRGQQIEVDE